MPTITSNNVTLYYENQGKGKTIIFTHGAS